MWPEYNPDELLTQSKRSLNTIQTILIRTRRPIFDAILTIMTQSGRSMTQSSGFYPKIVWFGLLGSSGLCQRSSGLNLNRFNFVKIVWIGPRIVRIVPQDRQVCVLDRLDCVRHRLDCVKIVWIKIVHPN